MNESAIALGKLGGLANSPKQAKARRKNMQKAQRARWAKAFHPDGKLHADQPKASGKARPMPRQNGGIR